MAAVLHNNIRTIWIFMKMDLKREMFKGPVTSGIDSSIPLTLTRIENIL